MRRFSIKKLPISSPSDDSTVLLRLGWYASSCERSSKRLS
jgi:hypothetical protein